MEIKTLTLSRNVFVASPSMTKIHVDKTMGGGGGNLNDFFITDL